MSFNRPKVITHMFMPGETVVAAIKKYNRYDVSKSEMAELLKLFKEVNTQAIIRPGSRVVIPILGRHHDAVFSSKETR